MAKHGREKSLHKETPTSQLETKEERHEHQIKTELKDAASEIEKLLNNVEAEEKENSKENVGHMVVR